MAITLDAINLPDDLLWVNEFNDSLIEQSIAFTVTGAQIVETGKKLKGRKIQLEGDIDYAWIERGLLKTLSAKVLDMLEMTLILHDGRSFNVMFDNESNPITAEQIVDYNDPIDTDFYSLKINFIEV